MISRDISRVIISGATSSIGIALCEECVTKGIGVVAIIRPDSSQRLLLPDSNLIVIVEGELSDYDNIESEGINADAFIHLAWSSTNGAAARDNTYAQADNIQATLKAVELAERCGCKVFVGAGSQAEYGRTNAVLTGDTECNPETAYGMTMGTSQMLACMTDRLHQLNKNVKVDCYGQELNPETYAIAKADMLIKGGDADNFKQGDTLDDDKFKGYTFDYIISNPPFGIDWKKQKKAVEDEADKGINGRFPVGTPKISDGQMLFTLNGIKKLKDTGKIKKKKEKE